MANRAGNDRMTSELEMTTLGIWKMKRKMRAQIAFQLDCKRWRKCHISEWIFRILVDCKRLHLFSQLTIYDKL